LPVLQLLVRPPYNTNNDFIATNQDNLLKLMFYGTPSSLNKYLALDWDTRYRFAFSKRFEQYIDYAMSYQRVGGTHKFIQLNHFFTTGLTYHF
jgi:hypothetical protein